jgi:hypothetical protein
VFIGWRVHPDDEPELDRDDTGEPSRREVLRAGATGAVGLAAWSVPTIRPVARLATPGSKPPGDPEPRTTTPPSTDSSSSVIGSDQTNSEDDQSNSEDPPDDESDAAKAVGELGTSGPAQPVSGEPDFTG